MTAEQILFELIRLVVALVIAMAFIVGSAVILSWADRKVLGFTQDRLGPHHTGKWGLLQAVADTLKLVLKEDIVPARADRILHLVAPIVFVIPTVAAFAVLPLGEGLVAADLNVGLVYVVAVTSLAVIGVLCAGWGSNNKYSTLGAFRGVAQMISYEVPLVLSLVPPAMLAGTLALSGVVQSQAALWNVVMLPLGFLVFFICALAETNRAPFDLPEAESELVAGYITEYSGVRWAMFFMAEYGNMVIISAVATVLFLGGWHGPLLPGPFWMVAKVYALIFLFIWVRATLPRLRIDQLMAFSWKVLLPLTLVNIALVGVLVVLLPQSYQVPLAAINWILAIGLVISLPWLLRRSRRTPTRAGTPCDGEVPRAGGVRFNVPPAGHPAGGAGR